MLARNRSALEDREDRQSRVQAGIFGLQQDAASKTFPSGAAGIFGAFRLPGASMPQSQERSLRKGAIEAFVKTCERWQLPTSGQILLLGYGTDPSAGMDIVDGRVLSPSQDVKDRVGYVLGISVGLGTVFDESIQAELDWLNAPHPKLGGRTPLACMLEGRMVNLIAVAGLVAEERALS
jgi:hypothetical protein